MDAYNLAYLPMPAKDYLRWLQQAHHGNDDWTPFELALDASLHYDDVRRAARGPSSPDSCASRHSSAPPESDPGAGSARFDRFLALSRQIIAQEDLRLAVENCGRSCADRAISSDVERFLVWLQIRLREAESETRDAIGYGAAAP